MPNHEDLANFDIVPESSSIIMEKQTPPFKDAERLGLDADRICRETDASRTMEGIYIKVEENGEVVDRMKYVRASFLFLSATHHASMRFPGLQ